MKRIFILQTFILLFNFLTTAQITLAYGDGEEKETFIADKKTTIDTCKLTVQYYMTVVPDTLNSDVAKDYFMILQLGNQVSKFFDFYKMKTDSLGDIYASQKMDAIEASNKLIKIDYGSNPSNYFMDYPKGKITSTERLPGSGLFIFSEDMVKPDWKLENKDSTILGYNCKKATTAFRGRNYTAWYTPEIPISSGPWKFWGLPGLILNVADSKHEYTFKCAGVEKSKWFTPIYFVERNYFKSTKKAFNNQLKHYYDNPGATYENSGIKFQGATPKFKSRPYNPIELSE